MYYYPHHIGDFISDTARLTDSQCMAYLRLIWHYYDTEKPLENDPESLAFKIGANASDVGLILKHYFILDGDVWKKSRCDNVISEYHGKADKARKSAEARWKNADAKRTDSERNANASKKNANASKSDANQEPRTNNQEPSKELKTITPQAADHVLEIFEYWKAQLKHPKAKLDDKRKKLINNALKLGYEPHDLMDAIEGCSKSPYHMGCDGRNTTVYDDLELILRDAKHIDQFLKVNLNPPAPSGVNYGSHQQPNQQRGLDPDDTSWIDRVYGPEPTTGGFASESSVQIIEGDFSSMAIGNP